LPKVKRMRPDVALSPPERNAGVLTGATVAGM